MRAEEIEVRNPSGIHARPAALFVKAAARFASAVTVENVTRGTAPANAKSLITLLGAGVSRGHVVRISADGPDEDEAIAALREAVASGLGEALEG
jgi:phosphotransferase system HPr (HPr) family protein